MPPSPQTPFSAFIIHGGLPETTAAGSGKGGKFKFAKAVKIILISCDSIPANRRNAGGKGLSLGAERSILFQLRLLRQEAENQPLSPGQGMTRKALRPTVLVVIPMFGGR